jgi:hypothetical protein
MLDRLQPKVDTAIVACARDDNGWAILMHDMTPGQMPNHGYPEQAENDQILSTMAAIHSRFWGCPELRRPELGLGTLPTIMRATTPSVHSRQKYQAGFERLHDLFEPDVAAILRELILDPQPLCDVFAHYPETLVHGDFKPDNLMWRDQRGGKITVLDWQMAAAGLCTIDLGWYLASPSVMYAEAYIETYRRHLTTLIGEVFLDSEWQTVLDLGLLAGLMRCCCQKAWKTFCDTDLEYQAHVRLMVPHWNQWVRNGAKWL